jgi:hypothetical protein
MVSENVIEDSVVPDPEPATEVDESAETTAEDVERERLGPEPEN